MDERKSVSMTSSGDRKRKRSTPSYYVVRAGHNPGIYYNWSDVQEQIKGFKSPVHKKFTSLSEAESWQKDGTLKSSPTKYYGVKAGHAPGVYTDYSDVLAQIRGYPKGKQKSFKTREEAQAYVDEAKATSSETASKRMTPADISTAASAAASTKGEAESELSLADARKGCKVSDNAPKRLKKSNGFTAIDVFNGDFEPGEGPLPPDAEDGFDPTIRLDPSIGRIVRKSEAELNAKKWQPTGEFSGPLVVYTDGSSLGNGKVGAVAGVGVYFGSNDPRNVSEGLSIEGKQTNQRAELYAIKRALDIVPINRDTLIYSDSNYAIKCVTEWFINWRKNGWKTSSGKVVDNKDIIEPILDRINERKLAKADTKFTWLKGHANDPGNVAADALAVNGARDAQYMKAIEGTLR